MSQFHHSELSRTTQGFQGYFPWRGLSLQPGSWGHTLLKGMVRTSQQPPGISPPEPDLTSSYLSVSSVSDIIPKGLMYVTMFGEAYFLSPTENQSPSPPHSPSQQGVLVTIGPLPRVQVRHPFSQGHMPWKRFSTWNTAMTPWGFTDGKFGCSTPCWGLMAILTSLPVMRVLLAQGPHCRCLRSETQSTPCLSPRFILGQGLL